MSTPNLAIAHMADSQYQKEVTFNDAIDLLDLAMTALVSKALTGNVTLTSAEALQAACVKFTGALAADATVTVPNNKKLTFFENATTGGFKVTVKTVAGTGIAVAPGKKILLRCDGTNVVHVLPHQQSTISADTALNANAATNIDVTLPVAYSDNTYQAALSIEYVSDAGAIGAQANVKLRSFTKRANGVGITAVVENNEASAVTVRVHLLAVR